MHIAYYIKGGPKKVRIDLEENYLKNPKKKFDGVFLSIHILTSSQKVRAF